MPQMTLHRNFVLRTTKGHSVRFVKGEPVLVPPICVEDAVAIGAIPVKEGEGDVIPEEPVVPVLTQAERTAKINEALETMVKRQERNDFTGNGLPSTKKLEQLVGFEVHSRERDSAWKAFRIKMENPNIEAE
jgi:hypothetical protein